MFANEETAERLRGLVRRSAFVSETAISIIDNPPDHSPDADGVTRVLWLSHAFRRKGLNLAVEGFTYALRLAQPDIKLELVVVGDGESLADAKLQVERNAIADHVRFMGAVPHDEVNFQMRRADMFLFTSVQDTSGNVLLEAMNNGKPIVALDHQGAKALIKQGGAVLVPIQEFEATAKGIGQALAALAADPAERSRRGAAGRLELNERHSWAAKRENVRELYEKYVL
jgi:glycosyltransferase involved in cell wall biosynthesis